MKKFLLLAIMAIVSLGANAQQEAETYFIKPELGMVMGKYSKLEYSKPRFSTMVGIEGGYMFTDRIGASVGFRYGQYGGKMKGDEDCIQFKMDYINIPLLANVYIVKGLAVKTGVEVSFNTRAKVRMDLSGTTWEGQELVNELKKLEDGHGDIDYSNGTNNVIVSIPVGLSYELGGVVLDARYNIGVTKAFKSIDDAIQNSFVLTLGYKLNFE